MGSFVITFDQPGTGLRVAIKDLIDLAGTPTSAGCRVLALRESPANHDADCMEGIRAAQASGEIRIVGKTNLNELAYGVTGLNPWFSSPLNPLDPNRVVGGSSSGSAAALGHHEADIAIGSDTGGSIRIPAACCGVAGLKTTAGRIPLRGVWPLAPTLDTIGPMARDVAGLVAGMTLLEPGFAVIESPVSAIGRVRLAADPLVERAVDDALLSAGLRPRDLRLPGWDEAHQAGMTILAAEAWTSNQGLARTGGLSPEVALRLRPGSAITAGELAAARRTGERWRAEASSAMRSIQVATEPSLDAVRVLAMPTLSRLPPSIEDAGEVTGIRLTMPWNLAGWPALSIPVPTPGGGMPTSLQLVAEPGAEGLLLATAAVIESAVG